MHAQVVDDAVHVHYVFPLDLEEQTVDGDEGACTSNTGTECRQRRREQRQRETEYQMKQFRSDGKSVCSNCVLVFCRTCSGPQ